MLESHQLKGVLPDSF